MGKVFEYGKGNKGINTSDATATAASVLSGYTAYVKGNKITGTITSKTISDITQSGNTITIPVGYYASAITKTITPILTFKLVKTLNMKAQNLTYTLNASTMYLIICTYNPGSDINIKVFIKYCNNTIASLAEYNSLGTAGSNFVTLSYDTNTCVLTIGYGYSSRAAVAKIYSIT